MSVKILAYHRWANVKTLTKYHIRHMKILLSLLLCLNIFVLSCYQRVNIFFGGISVHTGVNPAHFKGAHLDPDKTYKMKLTCWPWWTWDYLLEHKIQLAEKCYILRIANKPGLALFKKINGHYNFSTRLWNSFSDFMGFYIFHHNISARN